MGAVIQDRFASIQLLRWLRRGIFAALALAYFGYSWMVYHAEASAGKDANLESQAEQRGKLVWQRNNCQACHQIYGLGGYLGPDLTDFMSASGKGEPWLRAMLQSGPRAMPVFSLPEQDIVALAAFLATVDSSGNFPDSNARFNAWGSFEL